MSHDWLRQHLLLGQWTPERTKYFWQNGKITFSQNWPWHNRFGKGLYFWPILDDWMKDKFLLYYYRHICGMQPINLDYFWHRNLFYFFLDWRILGTWEKSSRGRFLFFPSFTFVIKCTFHRPKPRTKKYNEFWYTCHIFACPGPESFRDLQKDRYSKGS